MKELSIEQKAELYDEAIERTSKLVNEGCLNRMTGEFIFPKLKDSEDERIRKALIEHIKSMYDGCCTKWSYKERDLILAWLEKQGEQKPAWSEEDESRMDNLCHFLEEYGNQYYGHLTLQGTISWLKSLKNRVLLYPVSVEYNEEDIDNIADMFIPEPVWNALEESEGEGSNAAAYDYSQMIAMFKAGVHWLESLKDRVQPKPAWSEEDDIMVHDIDYALRCQITYPLSRLSSMSSWINSLKDKVQPQQEWSKEDEKKRNLLINILNVNYPSEYFKVNPANTLNMEAIHTKELINWLKSLRPQSQWKPDKTMLDTLQLIIYHPYSMSDYQQEILINLLEQLKKLRKELI